MVIVYRCSNCGSDLAVVYVVKKRWAAHIYVRLWNGKVMRFDTFLVSKFPTRCPFCGNPLQHKPKKVVVGVAKRGVSSS